jgi:hypothetical protein
MNIKESNKEAKIKILIWLSNYVKRPFEEMTKQDIPGYSNILLRAVSEDPNRKQIGSYNGRQMIIKFYL